jgi:monothiol glutaredoxin
MSDCGGRPERVTARSMPRFVLPEERIHPKIRERIATLNVDIVQEVEESVRRHDIVVVGMKQNPHPRRARKLLDQKGVAYHYIEHGSYLGPWRRRNALKMWTGWPTFPMIFVKGVFIGGANELGRLIEKGELAKMLAGGT